MPLTPFADRLAALVEERRSQICLGLDPDPARLGPEGEVAARGAEAPAAERAAAGRRSALPLVDRRAGPPASPSSRSSPASSGSVRRGGRRWSRSARRRGTRGCLTIADGKRGDVPVTAAAYAQALVGETPTPWGSVAGLGADAFTANPLLGRDALEPLVEAAAGVGAGIFVLVRTSNPGAADIQDLPAPERPLHERLATLVDGFGEQAARRGRA